MDGDRTPEERPADRTPRPAELLNVVNGVLVGVGGVYLATASVPATAIAAAAAVLVAGLGLRRSRRRGG